MYDIICHLFSMFFFISTSGIDWIVSPQKMCWSPTPSYLRAWPFFGNRVVAGVISLDEVKLGKDRQRGECRVFSLLAGHRGLAVSSTKGSRQMLFAIQSPVLGTSLCFSPLDLGVVWAPHFCYSWGHSTTAFGFTHNFRNSSFIKLTWNYSFWECHCLLPGAWLMQSLRKTHNKHVSTFLNRLIGIIILM